MQVPTELRVAAILYMLLGIYAIVFPLLYDVSLLFLYVVGGLSILCGIGAMLLKKWGLWVSVVLLPVMLTLSVVTLYYSVSLVGFYPDWERALFNISLIFYLVLSVLGFLLVIDRRRDLK